MGVPTAAWSEQCLAYIRRYYNVPAEVGVTVDFEPRPGDLLTGTIVGGQDAHLLVDFAGQPSAVLHPTWNVVYRPGVS